MFFATAVPHSDTQSCNAGFYVSVVYDFSGIALGDVLQMGKKKQVRGGGT